MKGEKYTKEMEAMMKKNMPKRDMPMKEKDMPMKGGKKGSSKR